MKYGTCLCTIPVTTTYSHTTATAVVSQAQVVSSSLLLFAVGYRCGQVILYDGRSMLQQEIITLPCNSSKNSSSSSNSISKQKDTSSSSSKGTTGRKVSSEQSGYIKKPAPSSAELTSSSHKKYFNKTTGTAVTGMYTIGCSNNPSMRMLLVAQETGDLTLLQIGHQHSSKSCNGNLASVFSPSAVYRLPPPLYYNTAVPASSSSSSASVPYNSGRTHNPFQSSVVIATCVGGDDRIFALIRKHSNVLELYFHDPLSSPSTTTTTTTDQQLPYNYLNISLKTPYDLSNNEESGSSAYFPAALSELYSAGADISMIACHVIITGRTYIISIVGSIGSNSNSNDINSNSYNSPLYLFSGSVTISDTPQEVAATIAAARRAMPSSSSSTYSINKRSTITAVNSSIKINHNIASGNSNNLHEQKQPTETHNIGNNNNNNSNTSPYLATLRQRVRLLDDHHSLSLEHGSIAATVGSCHNIVSFYGLHCAVCTPAAIYVVDLLKVYTSATGIDLQQVAICTIPLNITMLGDDCSTWANSTLLLSALNEQEEENNNEIPVSDIMMQQSRSKNSISHFHPLSLIVYRKHKAAILKFRIGCN